MPKKPLSIAIAVLVLAGAAFWIYRLVADGKQVQYRFATVERGNVESAVSATGNLSAVTTVQVGTQVSGQIAEIYVDFNDPVTKGQLIARIDPTLQRQAVQDAQASLDRARAELERARVEFERNQRLFENKVLTEVEFNSAKYSYEVARANARMAEINLERAKQNLEYTAIYSPIDGIVVERNVDVGQTVAASYSTPQLFLIAQDLSKMQILALVDESDIGLIKTGQPVRFSVQAYPDQRFEGRVEQVRLQSSTQENVVNYTVVVGVDNSDGKLLPGMTATLEFLTGSASDVLLVPNMALRFRPPAEVMAQFRKDMQARMQQRGEGGQAGPGQGANGPAGSAVPGRRPNGGFQRPNGGRMGSGMMGGGFGGFAGGGNRLWYLDEKGRLAFIPVKVGITDGQKTEVSGPGLKEGMEVIVGVVTEQQNTQSMFQPQGPGGPGGQRRRMF